MLQQLLLLFSIALSQIPSAQTNLSAQPVIAPIDKIKALYRTVKKRKMFKQHKAILRYAFERFKDVPGFDKTLDNLTKIDRGCCPGFLYELEAARELHDNNFTITGFNQLKASPSNSTLCCEIDLEVQNGDEHYWVECKNSHWNNPSNIRKQLIKQEALLQDWNATYKTDIKHMLCSKNSMPERTMQWAERHSIVCW